MVHVHEVGLAFLDPEIYLLGLNEACQRQTGKDRGKAQGEEDKQSWKQLMWGNHLKIKQICLLAEDNQTKGSRK